MRNVVAGLALVGEITIAVAAVYASTFGYAGATAHATPPVLNCAAEECVVTLARCQYEDGNPDGLPCIWTDPDTGDGYWVGSEDYR